MTHAKEKTKSDTLHFTSLQTLATTVCLMYKEGKHECDFIISFLFFCDGIVRLIGISRCEDRNNGSITLPTSAQATVSNHIGPMVLIFFLKIQKDTTYINGGC